MGTDEPTELRLYNGDIVECLPDGTVQLIKRGARKTMTQDITVRQLASLGGQARASKLGRKRRKAIAASGGTAAQKKLSTAERRRRAKKAWETRRAKLADAQPSE